MTVTGLGYARFFVNAFAGVEGSWVKSSKFYPFSMMKDLWQQQELTISGNRAGMPMPLMPISNVSIRLSSGCLSIKISVSAVKRSMRFSNWVIANLASLSTAFGVSDVAVSACR